MRVDLIGTQQDTSIALLKLWKTITQSLGAVGNDFDVDIDNVKDTIIDAPTASEKQAYINRRVNLVNQSYRQAGHQKK